MAREWPDRTPTTISFPHFFIRITYNYANFRRRYVNAINSGNNLMGDK